MRDSVNLLLTTLSVLILYSSCQCLCSRRIGFDFVYDGPWPAECRMKCPWVYRPVCGTDGKTYGNYCDLKRKMCEAEPVLLKHLGECGKVECGAPCKDHHAPVCGTDGVTYGNLCKLHKAMVCEYGRDVVLAYDGRCKADEHPPKCSSDCPLIYRPVCGTNGKTYGNICVLEYAICMRRKVAFAHEGRCVDRVDYHVN